MIAIAILDTELRQKLSYKPQKEYLLEQLLVVICTLI